MVSIELLRSEKRTEKDDGMPGSRGKGHREVTSPSVYKPPSLPLHLPIYRHSQWKAVLELYQDRDGYGYSKKRQKGM
ncbi:hypothetical protein E1301_Tti002936 [Triplophysa tibetana]|uniref:Uncharacterized protein n=1 Tax=Triplophysa tibetana TaxID=1572043 RepID=A0A5A9NPY6_9TELE|nr:hypothetical protein E1301_Tti002936 [Triplophysa tibetana]